MWNICDKLSTYCSPSSLPCGPIAGTQVDRCHCSSSPFFFFWIFIARLKKGYLGEAVNALPSPSLSIVLDSHTVPEPNYKLCVLRPKYTWYVKMMIYHQFYLSQIVWKKKRKTEHDSVVNRKNWDCVEPLYWIKWRDEGWNFSVSMWVVLINALLILLQLIQRFLKKVEKPQVWFT